MLSEKSIFIIRWLCIASYFIYKNNKAHTQQDVLSLISASDVPQIIQFTYCLYTAERNPEYEYRLSYFITIL